MGHCLGLAPAGYQFPRGKHFEVRILRKEVLLPWLPALTRKDCCWHGWSENRVTNLSLSRIFLTFAGKVSSLGNLGYLESCGIWCWLVVRTLQEVMLSWTQYFYPGQGKGGTMEANQKSMVCVGDTLSSHFRFQGPLIQRKEDSCYCWGSRSH